MPLQITEEEWGQTHLVKARQMKKEGTSPSRPLSSNSLAWVLKYYCWKCPLGTYNSSRNWKPGQSSLLFSCLMLFYWWVSSCCFKMSLKSIHWVIIPRLFFFLSKRLWTNTEISTSRRITSYRLFTSVVKKLVWSKYQQNFLNVCRY